MFCFVSFLSWNGAVQCCLKERIIIKFYTNIFIAIFSLLNQRYKLKTFPFEKTYILIKGNETELCNNCIGTRFFRSYYIFARYWWTVSIWRLYTLIVFFLTPGKRMYTDNAGHGNAKWPLTQLDCDDWKAKTVSIIVENLYSGGVQNSR